MKMESKWHESVYESGLLEGKLYIGNMAASDLPHGIGNDKKEALEDFVKNCDSVIEDVLKVKAEAENLLKEMSK